AAPPLRRSRGGATTADGGGGPAPSGASSSASAAATSSSGSPTSAIGPGSGGWARRRTRRGSTAPFHSFSSSPNVASRGPLASPVLPAEAVAEDGGAGAGSRGTPNATARARTPPASTVKR